MKKLLLTMTATLVCVGAFAQGQLNFANYQDNLIIFTTDVSKLILADRNTTADNGYGAGAVSIAGSTLYTGDGLNATPGTIASLATPTTFVVALYAGLTSSSLSLVTTTPMGDSSTVGFFVPANTVLPNGVPSGPAFPAGVPAWFQVQIYNAAYADTASAWQAGQYGGESAVFQATPTGVPSPIYQTGAPVNSGWLPGTVIPTDLPDAVTGGGYFGGIAIQDQPYGVVPEPGTFALAGMGLAALLVFRRRS